FNGLLIFAKPNGLAVLTSIYIHKNSSLLQRPNITTQQLIGLFAAVGVYPRQQLTAVTFTGQCIQPGYPERQYLPAAGNRHLITFQ
ncbi:TPA: hypothetical protein ACIA3T_003042, partial [Salmonella enterica subsp. enterica serovar Saintpaul]